LVQTDEERKARQKVSRKKYQASAKGQEYIKKYSQDSEHKTYAKNIRDDARLKKFRGIF
jgi:hypothetical protein